VTGVANYAAAEVWGKFIELLRELRPGFRELGVLWDYAPPGFPDGHVPLPIIEKAAQRMGIKAQMWMVRSEPDLSEALSGIERNGVEAVIMTTGGGIHIQPDLADRIGQLFIRRRLPAITDIASAAVFQRASCMLAYSPNVPEILGRLAALTDRVLRGANPGELPFEQPSRFDLAINAKAAKATGVVIPQSLLLRADRVIE
jgi:putative ABC transport system substrate-binding protein